MSNPINTLPIQQFIQQVKSAELSQQKEVKIDIKSAKMLAYSLGEITAKLLEDQDELLSKLAQSQGSEVTIKMDGGGFSATQMINICVYIKDAYMSRPKPKVLLEYTNKKNYKTEQVLESDAIWAVFYKNEPFNLKSFNSLTSYPGPKYKKVSFSNP